MNQHRGARFKSAEWGHAEIKDVETDGKDLIITGVASTGLVDRANEIVDQKSLAGAIKAFTTKTLFHMHNWHAAIGTVLNMAPSENELLVEARVGKNFEIPIVVESLFGASVVMTSVNNVREQIKQGILNAFSIGFTAAREKKKDADEDDPTTLKVLELLELSVVTIPANRDCLFSMAKGFTLDDMIELYGLGYERERPSFGNVAEGFSANSLPDLGNTTSDGDDEDRSVLIGGLQECLTKIQRS